MRLAAEGKLKRAEVKAVGATASLELGIDIGAVELIVQLDSPRSLSIALQRIGRAAHTRHGVPKARLFPLSRDQLVECAAIVRGIRANRLEETRIPAHPLDILAQQIVAIAACQEISEDALYPLVRRAWPYRELSRDDFDDVVRMHADGVAKRAGRTVGARLHRGAIGRTCSGRRGSRLGAPPARRPRSGRCDNGRGRIQGPSSSGRIARPRRPRSAVFLRRTRSWPSDSSTTPAACSSWCTIRSARGRTARMVWRCARASAARSI